jgi:hypothetical protein
MLNQKAFATKSKWKCGETCFKQISICFQSDNNHPKNNQFLRRQLNHQQE